LHFSSSLRQLGRALTARQLRKTQKREELKQTATRPMNTHTHTQTQHTTHALMTCIHVTDDVSSRQQLGYSD